MEVKVLVDAVGNWYGLKPVAGILRKNDVDVAYFNPARFSWRMAFFNLRTHRKMLIVDGTIGFTGGMTIRKNHITDDEGKAHMRDTHFKVTGPAVDQLMYSFADDWAFSTSEVLNGVVWFGKPTGVGTVMQDSGMVVRTIADGPDEDENKTEQIWASAISSAEKTIMVQTPYFVPGETLMTALCQAAMRGVKVTVLIPERSNLRFVDMASWVLFPDLLRAGVKVLHGTAPFDHSKLLVIDSFWSVIGSSNWDARSLLLNFEFNMEVYDKTFAAAITDRISENAKNAKTLSLNDIEKRSLAQKLLDKFVWLASPYL